MEAKAVTTKSPTCRQAGKLLKKLKIFNKILLIHIDNNTNDVYIKRMETVVKILREKNSFSQEELAKKLGVSRQSYIKYENGTTEMPLEIVRSLSKSFDVDYSCIIDNKLPTEPSYDIKSSASKDEKGKSDIRISIPENNIEKFKQVFLYILAKVGAKPNVGQTVLYKLFYFIDFDYYELYEKQLMGLSYIKNTFGPTPVDFAKLSKQMIKEGQIEEVKSEFYNHEMTKYFPLVNPNLELLSAKELEFIDSELEKYSGKTATELSALSHKDIPWIGAKDREVLDYESVFYRTQETSVRTYEEGDD